MPIYDDNSLTIGNTPLVKIQRISSSNILVKIESRNPANSVKCRIGASMIWDAEKSGRLKPGMEIIEPTSGNTGIALCFVAASRGYPITLTMPNTMSLERRQVMKSLGANIILTEGAKGIPAAISKAEEIVSSEPEKYFMPSQFDNPANPEIHRRTTGPEIWEDTQGDIDILICGVGTGGTLSGICQFIKGEKGKAITAVAIEPASSTMITSALKGEEPTHGPHKIQGIGAGFVPKNLNLAIVDEVELVSSDDAFEMARKASISEGILAGISTGATLTAALRIAARPEMEGKNIVAIGASCGERYLSTPLAAQAVAEVMDAVAEDS